MLSCMDCLWEWYKEGFAPGPYESMADFELRVKAVKGALASPEAFLEAVGVTYESIDDVSPGFLVIRSKKGLAFWFGAMTYICEWKGQKIPIIELPKGKRGLGLTTNDLIAHEEVHFLRSTFCEPRFEEVIAYRTSRSKWRKWLGPIFQNPWESYLCMAFFLSFPFLPFIPFFYALIITVIVATYLTLITYRLFRNQTIYQKAMKRLSYHYKNCEEILKLYTDLEIKKTAKGKSAGIPKSSPRGKLLLELINRQKRRVHKN